MANNTGEVSNWMKRKNIVVPNDWLEACLNWVVEEHSHEDLSLSKIKTYVYEQWLLADLREIGSSCLSDDVFTNQKCTLHGIYALQILDIRDISQPSYSQLLKLRGNNNQNSIVSAEPQQSFQQWEVKPKRMMMMTLTDGIKSLQAMEYMPIPSLRFDLPPGTKLQICGPIDCRLGILLLTAEKIRILGGEVESLVAENSNERVLLRMLGQNDCAMEERSNRHHTEDNQSIDSGINISEGLHTNNSRTGLTSSCQNNSQHSLRNSNVLYRAASHSLAISDFSNNRIDLTVSNDVEAFPDSTCNIVGPDEFEDDDDDFLTNLDYDHIDQLVQECSGTSSERNKNETVADSSSCKIRAPPPMLLDIPDWDLDDFI